MAACPECKGVLNLRRGKHGTFYGCRRYPDCRFTATAEEAIDALSAQLGTAQKRLISLTNRLLDTLDELKQSQSYVTRTYGSPEPIDDEEDDFPFH